MYKKTEVYNEKWWECGGSVVGVWWECGGSVVGRSILIIILSRYVKLM